MVTRVRDADNLVQPENDELERKRRKEKKRSWLMLRVDGVQSEQVAVESWL